MGCAQVLPYVVTTVQVLQLLHCACSWRRGPDSSVLVAAVWTGGWSQLSHMGVGAVGSNAVERRLHIPDTSMQLCAGTPKPEMASYIIPHRNLPCAASTMGRQRRACDPHNFHNDSTGAKRGRATKTAASASTAHAAVVCVADVR